MPPRREKARNKKKLELRSLIAAIMTGAALAGARWKERQGLSCFHRQSCRLLSEATSSPLSVVSDRPGAARAGPPPRPPQPLCAVCSYLNTTVPATNQPKESVNKSFEIWALKGPYLINQLLRGHKKVWTDASLQLQEGEG